MHPMRHRICIFLFIVFFLAPNAVCAETTAVVQLSDLNAEAESIPIEMSLKNIVLRLRRSADLKKAELFFDVFIENLSEVKKYDIVFPLTLRVIDEFKNSYHELNVSANLQKTRKVISLYPGENVKKTFNFQAPVPAAQTLVVQVVDFGGNFEKHIRIPTKAIKNWNFIADAYQYSNDDLWIVYPKDKRIFSPGEIVFLKVDFSERAGKPKNIHVVFLGYILTDEQSKGRYEVMIPEGYTDGNMEIVVMAEWGDEYHSSQIISKTLFLEIKG